MRLSEIDGSSQDHIRAECFIEESRLYRMLDSSLGLVYKDFS